MKAVILAGGQGTRLRPLTENVPKPMLPMLGRPIMENIIRHLIGFGIKEIVTTLHFRPRTIRDRFGDGSDFEIQMNYTLETEPLGTAGSVKLSQGYLGDTFLVIAGDALVDFDFQAFLDFHRASESKVTLCLTRVRDPGEFGIVITNNQGRVERFLEKPGPSEVFSDTVNTGIYLIEPDMLEQIPEGHKYDFAADLFPALLKQGVPMYGYVAQGYWSDIGTLDQFRQAHWDLLDGKVAISLGGNRTQRGVWEGEDVVLAPGVVIKGPCWIGNNVRVNAGARIGPYAVISDNVEVDRYATVYHSIVMRNSFVGERADLRKAIVAPRNIIAAQCELGDDVVLGSGCRLGQGVRVNPGVLVWPDKEIDTASTVVENLVWESLLRPSIFGSRGVSGLANLHITPEYAAALGKAFGTWVKKGRKVAISRDAHRFSLLIKRAFVSGLLSVGVDVDDLEINNGPITRFLAAYMQDVSGGVHVRIADEHPNVSLIEMFTASGLPLPRNIRRKIEGTFHRADFPRVSIDQVGSLRYPGRAHDRYLDHLLDGLDQKALRRSVDKLIYYAEDEQTANILGEILQRVGIPHIQAGGFDNSDKNKLAGEVASIARLNLANGALIDRNAEKFQLIDDVGNVLPPKRTKEILTAAFIQSAPEDAPVFLIPDHAVFLRAMAEAKGRKVILTRKDPAACLDEATNHLNGDSDWLEFVHYYMGYDAVSGVLHLLEFLSNQQLSLREFEKTLPTCHGHLFVLPCAWSEMGRVMRELSHWPQADISNVPEGVQLNFDEGSVYVLPSSDVPQLEVAIEATRSSALHGFVEKINRTLRGLID